MKRAPLTNRLVEKQIEFLVNGVLSGSATLFIENGEIDSTNAEQAFYKAVRL
jgi:hypothetical protein